MPMATAPSPDAPEHDHDACSGHDHGHGHKHGHDGACGHDHAHEHNHEHKEETPKEPDRTGLSAALKEGATVGMPHGTECGCGCIPKIKSLFQMAELRKKRARPDGGYDPTAPAWVHALQAAREHNGKQVRLVKFFPSRGRWQCEVQDGSGTLLGVRPINLSEEDVNLWDASLIP